MADFNTNVPLWGNKGTKPSDGLLKDGYAPNDRPTAQNTNFMYNAFSNAIKEVQDNVPLESDILKKTGDVIEGTILSSPKQLKYSIDKGNATVLGNVNRFSDVSGDSKITITIPKDVVIPGRQTLVFSFLHSFKGGVINLDFSSTYVSDFATTNTDNIKNDEYRKVRLSFTLGAGAPYEDIVIVMSAREGNLYSCEIVEDFVTSGLIGVPYSLKADSLIALHEGAMLPKETRPTLDCNAIRTPYIGYTANAVNAPQGEKLGTLMVFVTAETSKLTQVFTGNTSGKVYYRTMNIVNTFSSWAEVLTGSALANALTNYATKEDLKTATAGMLTEESATNWQKFKVTDDSGVSITKSGYDLLNVDDLTNFDGYVTNATNMPATGTAGFYTRRVHSGPYIDVTFAQHSTASLIWRNSFNGSTKKWLGWTKFITEGDTATWQKKAITADNGAQLRLESADLNSSVVPGEYYADSCTNTPSSEGNGYLTIKAGNLGGSNVNNYFTQIYTGYVSGEMYSRSKKQGDSLTTWTPWVRLLSEKDFSNVQQYKLTESAGINTPLGTYRGNVIDLSTGSYELTAVSNTVVTDLPANLPSNSAIYELQVFGGTDKRKQFRLMASYDNRVWFGNSHTNGTTIKWFEVPREGVTAFNGTVKYALTAQQDIFVESLKWGNGVHTFSSPNSAPNNPAVGVSIIGTVIVSGGKGQITAISDAGTSYVTSMYTSGKWLPWSTMVNYGALDTVSRRLMEDIDSVTPVMLWEGSANGAGTKTYPLKQDVMSFSKIKITHYSGVFQNAVSEYAVPATIGDFWNCILSPTTNLTDARGDSPTIYEVAIRFNNTSFMIERDNKYDFATSKPTLNANQSYITKIEGVRK